MRWKAWLQANCKGDNDAIPILKDINYASDFNSRGVICPDVKMLQSSWISNLYIKNKGFTV